MKIMVTSDWHLDMMDDDKKDGSKFNPDIIDEIIETVETEKVDLFLFGGDLATETETFFNGLKLMARIPCRKLFIAGNNCMKSLQTNDLPHYSGELQARMRYYDIQLLDQAPLVLNGIGFVGNCGWYDGTFWWPENTAVCLDEMKERAQKYFGLDLGRNGFRHNLTYEQFFAMSWRKLLNDLKLVHDLGAKRVVLGIHHVPSRDFLEQKPGDESWTQINFCMGSIKYQELFARPDVVLGLVGHTHRPDIHLVGGTPVVNISYSEDVPYRVFDVKA